MIIRLLRVLQTSGPVPSPAELPDDVVMETRGRSHGNNNGLIQIKFLLAAAVNHSVTSNHESLILDLKFWC